MFIQSVFQLIEAICVILQRRIIGFAFVSSFLISYFLLSGLNIPGIFSRGRFLKNLLFLLMDGMDNFRFRRVFGLRTLRQGCENAQKIIQKMQTLNNGTLKFCMSHDDRSRDNPVAILKIYRIGKIRFYQKNNYNFVLKHF